MRKLAELTAIVMVLTVAAAPAIADTLVLTDGTRISGYFEGGTARVVKFRGTDGAIRDYDILKVQQVFFESTPVPAPAPAAAASAPEPAPAATVAVVPSASSSSASSSSAASASAADDSKTPESAPPQLRPASERPPAQPPSAAAANTGYTVPTGTKAFIRF